MNRILLLLRTARHLRARQIINRLTRRFAPAPQLGDAPSVRTSGAAPAGPFLPRPVSFLGSGRFRFLNQERYVKPKEFSERKDGLLWDYNFHYFDGLLAPSPDEDAKARWVEEWLAGVPVGSRPAWDPYPASRRICNWIKWSLSTETDTPSGFLPSLASQVRHLERTLEYHLLANHLLANAVALTTAGAFFSGREGDRWLRRGSALLERELEEQFHGDGAHFELSPVYHAVILEDLLDLILVARSTGVALPSQAESTARGAVDWLSAMVRPDGRVPLLNDAAYDQGPGATALLTAAERVLGEAPDPTGDGFLYLADSGYFRYQSDRLFVLGDVGQVGPDYQPGHVHCDMLSFELCWEDRPVLVDTGTSTYEIGPRRDTERGTAAHNTVQLGRLEQSEVWAGFRVARRARVEEVAAEIGGISATIRAFPSAWSRLSRSWRFHGETLEMEDRILSNPHRLPATARLHFHPDVNLAGERDQWTARGVQIRLEGASAVRNVKYHYAPEFSTLRQARCLEIDFRDRLLTRIQS